jgi:hypothetical protein
VKAFPSNESSGWPAQIADRLCVYQLPERDANLDTRMRVNMWRVKTFVEQFPHALQDSAWHMLEKFQMLDLYILTNAWANLSKDRNLIAVPLTAKSDESAQLMGYFISKKSVRVVSIGEAAGWRGPVWFFDDFLMSGKQARTSVQLMLGLKSDLEDEQVSKRLPDGAAQWFRSANITFLFACGTSKGQSSLEELLRDNIIAARVEMMHTARRLDDAPLDLQSRKHLRKFLRDVGFSLNKTNQSAKHNQSKWNDRLCKEWALGYGGLELLTASFYSVPTSTITAIWKQGNYDGKPWMPLLPRSA